MILPKREQLRDYWPIYHPQQSALKIEFLIALQMAEASAIDTATHRGPCDMGRVACPVLNFLELKGVLQLMQCNLI